MKRLLTLAGATIALGLGSAGGAQATPVARAFGLNTTYSGSGSSTVAGPIDLSAPAKLAWTNTGGHVLVLLVMAPHTLGAIVTSTAASGTVAVPAGSYVRIRITTDDRWTFTISTEAGSTATPTVSNVVGCLKANGASDVQETTDKPPAEASVSAKGSANTQTGLRLPFLIVFFNNEAGASAFVAKNASTNTMLLYKANGGQTLIYIANIPALHLLPTTQALISKCVGGSAQAAPPAGSSATPTLSSVVSCLKTGGAWDMTTSSKPPAIGGVQAIGEVKGTAPSNPGFAVLLFSSVAQAKAYAAKSPPGNGQTLVQTVKAPLALIYLATPKGAVGVAAAETLTSTCVGPNAGALPSTARSNPNTLGALVACLQAGKAHDMTTPNRPPAYGVVVGTTPSGPGFGVFLFDNIAQANAVSSSSHPASYSLFAADGGVTLYTISTTYKGDARQSAAAAFSAAKTLISGCLK